MAIVSIQVTDSQQPRGVIFGPKQDAIEAIVVLAITTAITLLVAILIISGRSGSGSPLLLENDTRASEFLLMIGAISAYHFLSWIHYYRTERTENQCPDDSYLTGMESWNPTNPVLFQNPNETIAISTLRQ